LAEWGLSKPELISLLIWLKETRTSCDANVLRE